MVIAPTLAKVLVHAHSSPKNKFEPVGHGIDHEVCLCICHGTALGGHHGIALCIVHGTVLGGNHGTILCICLGTALGVLHGSGLGVQHGKDHRVPHEVCPLIYHGIGLGTLCGLPRPTLS